MIEEDCRQRKPALTGSYWHTPTARWSPRSGEHGRDGRPDEVRGTRAVGISGEVRGTRALGISGEVRGDRASGISGEVRGDRASGISGEVRGDRASGIYGEVRGDRASGIHGEVRGDRASGSSGEVRGNRAFGCREEVRGDQGMELFDGVCEGRAEDGHIGDRTVSGGVEGPELEPPKRSTTTTGAWKPRDGQGAYQGVAGAEITGSGLKLELPLLPTSTTPMDLGDWLILIGPIMRDLSQHATTLVAGDHGGGDQVLRGVEDS